jgi:hypothetical protein
MGGQGHSTAASPPSPPRQDPVPIVRKAGRDPGTVWTGAEGNATAGICYSNRPGRSESLCRLSYPGTLDYVTMIFHLQLCTVEWGSVTTIGEGFKWVRQGIF